MQYGASNPFNPKTITVVIGINNTVKWTNNDPTGDPHTVTSDIPGQFDSGDLEQGQTFTCTFIQAGTYDYECVYHLPYMVGTVIVESG